MKYNREKEKKKEDSAKKSNRVIYIAKELENTLNK